MGRFPDFSSAAIRHNIPAISFPACHAPKIPLGLPNWNGRQSNANVKNRHDRTATPAPLSRCTGSSPCSFSRPSRWACTCTTCRSRRTSSGCIAGTSGSASPSSCWPVLRISWRSTHRPPPLPPAMPSWEKFAAHSVHYRAVRADPLDTAERLADEFRQGRPDRMVRRAAAARPGFQGQGTGRRAPNDTVSSQFPDARPGACPYRRRAQTSLHRTRRHTGTDVAVSQDQIMRLTDRSSDARHIAGNRRGVYRACSRSKAASPSSRNK